MMDEPALEEQEARVPPYYERFLEERDKRFSSELSRLETEIRHNGQRIDELKIAITRLDEKIEDVRTELKGEIADVRTELKGDITRLESKLDSHFRWMLGLLLPIILGVVALLIQNLLK